MKDRKTAYDHGPLGILLVIFLALAATFSLLVPLNEAVDEESHFDLVRFIAEHKRFPMTGAERASLGDKGDASPIYHGLVAVLSQHVDVTTLPQRHFVSPAKQAIPYDTILTTQDLHTEDELFPFRGIVLAWHVARLVSIPLSALTIIAAYLTALAIYPDRRHFALAVAGFVAFLPPFVFNSAVVNDDNLVIPLVAFAIYYQVRIIQGDARPRAFVILGALTGLAVITKYHSVVLLPEITLVFLVLAWRNRAAWRDWLKRWAWVMLSFLITTGWWFFFLFSRFNRVAELGLVGGLLAPLGDPTTTEVAALELKSLSISWLWIAPVFRTFWMVTRPLHVSAQDSIYLVLIVLTGISALGLMRLMYNRLTARRTDPWRLDITLLGLHLLLYLGIVFGRYQVFVARGVPPPLHSTQGRHLYPALISIAFFFVLGWRAALPRRPRHAQVARINNLALAGAVCLGMLALSLASFFLFIRPSYLPNLPILRLEPDDVSISHRTNVAFVEGLNLVGYNVERPNHPDQVLPLQLYWQAKATHERDYVARVCIHEREGDAPRRGAISCHWGHPGEGLYPTRAWDVGYLVRDARALPLPPCLEAGDYELTLSVWPLRDDVAWTSIDASSPGGLSAHPTVSLGAVTLTPTRHMTPRESYQGVYLCTVDGCQAGGKVRLPHIRQTLTVVNYQLDPSSRAGDKAVRFVRDNASYDDASSYDASSPGGLTAHPTEYDADDDAPTHWLPFQSSGVYQCPDGQTFQTHTFILDQSVVPGPYTLDMNGRFEEAFSIEVATHARNFGSPPAPETHAGISFANRFDLIGYDVDLSPRWPGDPIEVTTYWHTQRSTAHDYNAALHLLDNTQTTQQLSDHYLGGLYPNTLWAPGEYTQDRHVLQADDQTPPPGLYTLELRLYSYSQGLFVPLPVLDIETGRVLESPILGRNPILGQVRIMDPARTRSPAFAAVVELGQEIQLLGYDLADTQASPGEVISLALHWEAIAPPTTDYTVFTQLIGPDGLVWGQQDNQPQQGRYPTTAWSIRDRVVDRFDILVREDAPEGTYHLLAGMYNLATGERLPAVDESGNRLPDDAVTLGSIDIVRQLRGGDPQSQDQPE